MREELNQRRVKFRPTPTENRRSSKTEIGLFNYYWRLRSCICQEVCSLPFMENKENRRKSLHFVFWVLVFLGFCNENDRCNKKTVHRVIPLNMTHVNSI